MDTQIRFRVCDQRNVAAAFEHFQPRRHPLRAAWVFVTDELRGYLFAYFLRKALISSMRS